MRLKGLEPLTRSLEGCRSIHLSYWRLPLPLTLPGGEAPR